MISLHARTEGPHADAELGPRQPTAPTLNQRRARQTRWCRLSGGTQAAPGRRRLTAEIEGDHAVVPALAAVHHGRTATRGVLEEVEVMADQLHGIQGVIDGHRDGFE